MKLKESKPWRNSVETLQSEDELLTFATVLLFWGCLHIVVNPPKNPGKSCRFLLLEMGSSLNILHEVRPVIAGRHCRDFPTHNGGKAKSKGDFGWSLIVISAINMGFTRESESQQLHKSTAASQLATGPSKEADFFLSHDGWTPWDGFRYILPIHEWLIFVWVNQ